MFVVDSQVHIWGANTPERPWPAQHHPPHRPTPFLKDDLLREMNAAGVHRAVIVPLSWQGDRNDLGLEAARLHPDRFAVMGRLNLDSADARSRISGWRRQPGMLGIRLILGNPAAPVPLVDGRIEWVWAEAEKAGVPIMVRVQHPAAHYIDAIAACHPGLRLAIDHLGIANGQKGEQAFAELDKLLQLAKQPGIAVKVSALPCAGTDGYPYRSLHSHIRRVYDAFGPARMFWGADLTRLPCSYRQAVAMFTEEIPWLSTKPLSRMARAFVKRHSGTPAASVWGCMWRTTPEAAAFANGVMLRFLDMSDTYRVKSGGHPSDVIAGVLAVGEAVKSDGASVINAVTLAYDVYCSFCEAVDITSRGWDHPIYGGIACALGACKLLQNHSSCNSVVRVCFLPAQSAFDFTLSDGCVEHGRGRHQAAQKRSVSGEHVQMRVEVDPVSEVRACLRAAPRRTRARAAAPRCGRAPLATYGGGRKCGEHVEGG